MDAFEKALAFRWREEAGRKAAENGTIWTPGGNVELDGTHQVSEVCESMEWANAGQHGPVTPCTTAPGPAKCQIQELMERAPEWAMNVRADLVGAMAIYDSPDLNKLNTAYEDLAKCAKFLGQDYTEPIGPNSSLASQDDLGTVVSDMDSKPAADEVGFWSTWTGMASEAARTGFFNSVGVTLHNQRHVAAYLANLYSFRSSIIEAARVDTLTAINGATNRLDDKVTVSQDNNVWKVVSGATLLMPMVTAPAAVGVSASIVAFLGSEFLSKVSVEEYADELEKIVTDVKARVEKVSDDATTSEGKYEKYVLDLETSIKALSNDELELFDFSKNSATGDPSRQDARHKFSVTVEQVFRLADSCFRAAELYQDPLRVLIAADAADDSLTGIYGYATTGDVELIDLRDALVSFLQTSTARYYEAGRRAKEAATRYAESDSDQVDQMASLHDYTKPGGYWDKWDVPEDTPDLDGDKTAGKGGSIADKLGPTDRSDIEDGKQGQPEDDNTDPDAPSHGSGQQYQSFAPRTYALA